MTNRDEQLELVKLAEQAERYTDMVGAMKTVVESNIELTKEERNLFSIAYKNKISGYRASWRIVLGVEQKAGSSEFKRQITKEYREKIESELKDVCHELLTLLDIYLIPKAVTVESKVFYLKMKGDYHRYLAEVVIGNERKKMAEESQHAYKDGFDVAMTQMPATHPIRLGLILNLSVFHYEILNEPAAACRLAKQAFDGALSELDSIDAESYRDSSIILQLLRDNLTLWTSDESDFDNVDQSEEQH